MLISGYQSIAGKNLASEESIIINDKIMNNSYEYDEIIQEKTSELIPSSEDFDMYLQGRAWWVPYNDGQEGGFICHHLLIDYVGTYDRSQNYEKDIKIWIIYGDEQILFKSRDSQFGTLYTPWHAWFGIKGANVEPDSIIFEFKTDYPGEQIDNNCKTVDIEPGIIVEGSVKTTAITGEKIPLYAKIYSLSEESFFSDYYFFGYSFSESNGQYRITMPYIPGYNYPIKTSYAGVSMTKYLGEVEGYNYYTLDFLFIGLAPNAPEINGPENSKVGVESTFTLSAADPEGEDLFYYIDWGDGEKIEWEGPFSAGNEVEFSHSWKKEGNYQIKTMVKDVNGYKSTYTNFDISMTKTRQINDLFIRLINNRPFLPPVIQILSNLLL